MGPPLGPVEDLSAHLWEKHLYNWIRSHWRNGRHVVDDVPAELRSAAEGHLDGVRTRFRELGTVRLASVDGAEIAWIECEVQLDPGDTGLTYRRARYTHALVVPARDVPSWTQGDVCTLLEAAYGRPITTGVVAQQKILQRLTYPDGEATLKRFFVGRPATDDVVTGETETVLEPAPPTTRDDTEGSPTHHNVQPQADRAAPTGSLSGLLRAPAKPLPDDEFVLGQRTVTRLGSLQSLANGRSQ